ncbi:MAG: OmpA family protein [Sphingomonas sp.]|nr:OmpA family protein [Sphingomonas sp.]
MGGGNSERPIVIKRVKKVAAGHHGGAWKVAYADFVTAMMAFFMLLWLIANPDKQRLKGLAQYFSPTVQSGTGAEGTQAGTDSGMGHSRREHADDKRTTGQPALEAATQGTSRGGTANIPDASQRVMASELQVVLDSAAPDQTSRNYDVKPARDGLRITLMDTDQQAMFKSGTAELNPYARALLAKIATKLAKSGAPLSIEGHVDSLGSNGDANWRLSGERAMAARTALIGDGLPESRFAETVALGATQPVYPDQPARPENRRITIVLKAEAPSLPTDSSFQF